jgi:hypothetical protein|tara:strand:- start:1345 stop:1515 length:171 start_codon:yes stop_codon:yes gene_type:complete
MKQIPKDMVVPDWRRDISQMSNVRWLLRNLAIQNKDHPELDETIDMLIAVSRNRNN